MSERKTKETKRVKLFVERENSPEPTVEERGDEGEEIVEEGNGFSNDLRRRVERGEGSG